MADKVNFKMLFFTFCSLLVVTSAFSTQNDENVKSCNCYDVCYKNYTRNSEKDEKMVSDCERGCRLYTILSHISPKENTSKNASALHECFIACSQAYINPEELQACNAGCEFNKNLENMCKPYNLVPKVAYTFLFRDTDSILNTDEGSYVSETENGKDEEDEGTKAEPDPDDPMTDISLRKQIQKTIDQILTLAQKIPESRFQNYPIEDKGIDEFLRSNNKCPKFYGLDSKLEYRNGRIIIGDLYLVVGIFLFVLLCFILGHHIEAKKMARKMMHYRRMKKDDVEIGEPIIKVQISDDDEESVGVMKEEDGEYPIKTEVLDGNFETITFVFREESPLKEDRIKINPKI